MGVRRATVPVDGHGAKARLLSIPAGSALPEHGHHGLELTLVLKGAFRDGDKVYRRGDLAVADGDIEHTPIAEPGEDCICLVVQDAPLRFNSLLPRVAQIVLDI